MAPDILAVVAARPNFMKVGPVIAALPAHGVSYEIVHTGQHYDAAMSTLIQRDLGFPEPDHHLGVGSGTHAEQTGRTLIEFDRLLEDPPVAVLVAGDVNATLACSLAAVKRQIPIIHLEAGLRSGDWSMPEEINRIVTDRLSRLLLTHSPEAEPNLVAEGVDPSRIRLVGNTMIDTLRRLEAAAEERAAWQSFAVEPGSYVLVTLHRPSNVDVPDRLAAIVEAVLGLAARHPIVFPVHPRTSARLDAAGLSERLAAAGVRMAGPLPYIDFLSLELGAGAVATDSGGVQEETAALGVPCFTLRANTERPVTVTHGTNTMLGDDPASLARVATAPRRRDVEVPLWDGHAGERAAAEISALVREVRAG